MPVDTSIYFQGQRPVALEMPLDVAAKAQSLRSVGLQNQMNSFKVADVQREQQEKSSLSDILKKNTITDETGKTSLNRGAALSDIYKSNPKMAMEYQKQFEADDLEGLKKQGEIAKNLAWSANPDNWSAIKSQAIELGMKNADKLPDTFDPQFLQKWQMGTIEGEKQLAARVQQQQFEYGKAKDDKAFGLEETKFGYQQKKDAEENKLKKQHYGILEKQQNFENQIKLQTVANQDARGDNLPLDKKKIVEGLAGQNATKVSIKNNIEALTSKWDTLSEDDKVIMGKQLIKTLNSTEGKDAVGAEEAKRLASRLEFAYGNLTNDNPLQLGRDLGGFKKQAEMTAENIGTGVKSNQKVIDEAMGRKSTTKDYAQDPRVMGFMKKNGTSFEESVKILQENGKL